jgi:hypothetical protein
MTVHWRELSPIYRATDNWQLITGHCLGVSLIAFNRDRIARFPSFMDTTEEKLIFSRNFA